MMPDLKEVFAAVTLEKLFPVERSDQFFEALFGGTEDGAYDIRLRFKEHADNELRFEFELNRRPGKCLTCSLTHGLPKVFTRHSVINLQGLSEEIVKLLGKDMRCNDWRLGATQPVSSDLHVIPFTVALAG